MRFLIFTLFSLITFCGCYRGGLRGYIYRGDQNEIVSCRRCSSIKGISSNIEYLNIEDCNCLSIPTNWNFPHLKELTVASNKIQFPVDPPSFNLKVVSILDPVFDSVPPFIFKLNQLEGLIIFLKDDRYLDNQSLSTLKSLRRLKIGLSDMSSIPSFIYALDSLEQLVIFSNTPDEEITFSEDLLKLKNLEVLEAPIELSRSLSVLVKMPNLKKLKIKSLVDFDENRPLLRQLSHLEELCIEERLPEQQASLYEIIPSVNFICRDWHIKPLNWGRVVPVERYKE